LALYDGRDTIVLSTKIIFEGFKAPAFWAIAEILLNIRSMMNVLMEYQIPNKWLNESADLARTVAYSTAITTCSQLWLLG
jgi:hypothetical protein